MDRDNRPSLKDFITREAIEERVKAYNEIRGVQGRNPYNEIESLALVRLVDELFLPEYIQRGEEAQLTAHTQQYAPEYQKFNEIMGGIHGRQRNTVSRSAQALGKEIAKELRKGESAKIREGLRERSLLDHPAVAIGDPVHTDPERGAFIRHAKLQKK